MTTFEIEKCKAIRSTKRALLVDSDFFESNEDKREIWIPQSQIHEDSEVYKNGDEGKLVVVEWFAEKRGWI